MAFRHIAISLAVITPLAFVWAFPSAAQSPAQPAFNKLLKDLEDRQSEPAPFDNVMKNLTKQEEARNAPPASTAGNAEKNPQKPGEPIKLWPR